MELKMVTLTGVDESVDPAKIANLSRHFPFVEWGILLSFSRMGKDARYPSIPYLQKMAKEDARFAVHLCGQLAREAGRSAGFPIETACEIVPSAKRIQVNLGAQVSEYREIGRHLYHRAVFPGVQPIIQVNEWDALLDFPYYLAASVGTERDKVTRLLDRSGGKGIESPFTAPPDDLWVGFAGGITPRNVLHKVAEIDELGGSNPYWIDMETGVRTDDQFDLDKAEDVLLTVAKHLEAQRFLKMKALADQ